MCQIGDIIVVYDPKVNHKPIGQHAFIVLDDTNGIVRGLFEYDFISLLLTSYKDEDAGRKEKLAQYEGNFHISKDDNMLDSVHQNTNRNSYVEANYFFYFEKSKISYQKIGRLDEDIFGLIIDFINELQNQGTQIVQVFDKAKRIEEADT